MGQASSLLSGSRREAERQQQESEQTAFSPFHDAHSGTGTGHASSSGSIASQPLTQQSGQQHHRVEQEQRDTFMDHHTCSQDSSTDMQVDSSSSDNVLSRAATDTPSDNSSVRPSNLRMHSTTSSSGTVRPLSHSRTSSARSTATITSSTTIRDNEPDADMPESSFSTQSRRRSLMDKLRNRRFSSFSSVRRDSPASTAQEDYPTTSRDQVPSSSIPSTSSLYPSVHDILQQPAYVPGAIPVTPPEELDAMFEERQRARQLIEAALAQARSDLEHLSPGSSVREGQQDSQSIVIRAPNEDEALDPPAQVIPIMASSSLQSMQASEGGEQDTQMQDVAPQQQSFPSADSQLDTPPRSQRPISPSRIFAPLPRRASSRSPSPGARSIPVSSEPITSLPGAPTPVPLDMASSSSTSEPEPAQVTSPAPVLPSQTLLPTSTLPNSRPVALPRRILVQGIVAQSPPRTPTSSRPSTPTVVNQNRSRASSHRATEVYNPDMESSTPGDSGFWGELPGADSLLGDEEELRRDAGRAQHSSTGGETWDDAVAELLSLPYEESSRREQEATSSSVEAEDTEEDYQGLGSPMQQGALIGRLLSIAAAATAATMLPGGSITVNGQTISGFDDSDNGTMSAAGGSAGQTNARPASPVRARSSSLSAIHVRPRRATSLGNTSSSTAGSSGVPRPSAPPQRQGSGSLQGILRDALAAAFRTPPTSPPVASPRSEATSPLISPSLFGSPEASSETPASSLPTTSMNPSEPAVTPSVMPGTFAPARSPLETSPEDVDTVASPPLSTAPLPESANTPPAPAANAATRLSIPATALQADPQLSYGSTQPLGTFERFLADLQTDVSTAIVRYQEEVERAPSARSETADPSQAAEAEPLLPPASEDVSETTVPSSTPVQPPAHTPVQPPRRFAFFRAYRFPARTMATLLPASSSIPITSTSPADATQPAVPAETSLLTPDSTLPAEDPAMAADPVDRASSPVTEPLPSAAPSPAAAMAAPLTFGPNVVSANAEIVPMLLVGVRSMTRPLAEEVAEATESTSDAPRPEDDNVDPAMVPLPTDADGDVEMNEAGPEIPGPSDEAPPAQPTARHTDPASAATAGFVLWIMGGLYPSNHPIVIAPNLMSEEALSYEDMLRLAEIMGQHKTPTATKDEIEKSNLEVIKGEQVAQQVEAGKVLSITGDRCLVCLEDYEPDEDVRILQCMHCFHQPCVDKWLSQGANTCPACRTTGIKKEEIVTEAPETAVSEQETTTAVVPNV